MEGCSILCVECDETRIDLSQRTSYVDHKATTPDQALEIFNQTCESGEILTELVGRGIKSDLVTDQTSAHDLDNGYLPICWVGLGERHRLGEMVESGELKASIVIGRDHLDSGSVASPNRETESMQDRGDGTEAADKRLVKSIME